MKYISNLISIAMVLLGSMAICARAQEKPQSTRTPITEVLSDVPVGFSLLTYGDYQFVAFYAPNHSMTVGKRKIGEGDWSFAELPTKIVSDSHNYVTMDIDRDGHLHVSGNMHAVPLIYFRSAKPLDINSFEKIDKLVGDQENRVTYPHFMHNQQGDLIYHYRIGGSGNGNEIYDIYDEKTCTWSRLLDKPLTDGKGLMNAYMNGPNLIDGWYHLAWVWRDTPNCATNHDLSYARSRDLKNWENAFGKKVELPITLDNESLIVDPVPIKGGIINGCQKVTLDKKGRVLITYHKFDSNGNTQIYVSRTEGSKWVSYQISDWNYRWWFEGNGAINNEINIGSPHFEKDGTLVIPFDHRFVGTGYYLVDGRKLKAIKSVRTGESSLKVGSQDMSNVMDKSLIRKLTASDLGNNIDDSKTKVVVDGKVLKAPEHGRFHLEWEAWPTNRDSVKTGFKSTPSTLFLVDNNPDQARHTGDK